MRHPVVLLFVLTLHALVLVAAVRPDLWAQARSKWPQRPHSAPATGTPAVPSAPLPRTRSAVPAAAPTPESTRTAHVRLDPQAWLQAQEHARRQYRERHFGAAVADLLAAPDDGLAALAERARRGEAGALEAWLQRADDCQSLDAPPAAVLAPLSAERSADGRPDPRRVFADALVQARRDADAERALACAKANSQRERYALDWDALAREAPTPAAQRAAAELQFDADGDLGGLIARLRDLLRTRADSATELALAQHLTESADAAERDEGLERLRRLAERDSDALSALAQCLVIGCGAMAPRPDAAGDLLARSAELGFAWALERAIDEAQRRGDTVTALGWSRYRAWLNAWGCFAAPDDLGLRFYLADTRLEESLGDALPAAQGAAADAFAAARVQSVGALARRRAACD